MKRRTMYMHTLDGKPAQIERRGKRVNIYYALPLTRVRLYGSLGELRQEWNDCIESAFNRGLIPDSREAISRELHRYHYQLVRLPE